MKTKKILAAIAALTIICGAYPTQPIADILSNMAISANAVEERSGSCGDNATYTLDSEGKLTITGSGAITDRIFSSDQGKPNAEWVNEITSIEIGEGITEIQKYAFYECKNLKSVTIASSVKILGYGAFYNCNNLSDVTFKDNSQIEKIEPYVFYCCSPLTSIVIPDSVTSFGYYVFSGSSLSKVYYKGTAEQWGKISFGQDIKLGSAKKIYNFLYFDENGDAVTVETINPYSFDSETGTITKYKGTAKEVVIPSEIDGKPVTSIGFSAFKSCTALTSITIPNSVTSIGASAFNSCTALTSITIPNSVTSIGDYAFSACYNLTSIEIPESVTSISNDAFINCTSLNSVKLPASLTSIGLEAFYNCSSLTSISIPKSVTSIDRHAFRYCKSLKSIEIPDGVTSIGDHTFSGCTSLRAIVIPDSVTFIGSSAFAQCNINVLYTGSEGQFAEISGNEELCNANITYNFCNFDENGNAVIDEAEVTTLFNYSFDSATGTLTISGKGALPNYVIGGSPFAKDTSIIKVVIEDGITSIGSRTFLNCFKLTSITIPNSITSIGNSAFEECSSLASITIPDGVTSIGDSAFCRCKSLTSITAPCDIKASQDTWKAECDATVTYTHNNGTALTDAAVAATCTETGLTEGSHCSVCKEVFVAQKVVPAKGHTEVTDKAVTATCTEAGKTEGKHCSVCNTVLTAQEEVSALGHDFSEWSVLTPAACETAGTKERTCQRDGCTKYETADISATGHSYNEYDYCTVCKELKDGSDIKVLGCNFVLDGKVGVNLSFVARDDVKKVIINDTEYELTTPDENGLCTCVYSVSAKDLNKEISVKYGETELFSTTAEKIAEMYTSGSYPDEVKKVAEKLLTYSKACDNYFNNETNEVTPTAKAEVLAKLNDVTVPEIASTVADFKYYGSSLLCKDSLVVRTYFEYTGEKIDKDEIKASFEGATGIKGNDSKTKYYVYVDKDFTVANLDNTNAYGYSALCYIKTILENEEADPKLADVCCALYDYYAAAKEYIGGNK